MFRSFNEFVESKGIFDPKRDPRPQPYERLGELDPADDDYDFRKVKELDDMYDREDSDMPNKFGKTAQYPLAKMSGNPRGFQVKSPKELFSNQERLTGKEFVDNLRSKLFSGEHMSMKEVDILQKALKRELQQLDSQIRSYRDTRNS